MAMDHVSLDAVVWRETAPGVERGELPPGGPGEGAAMLRFTAGATTADHRHPGGEELFVFSGRLRVGDEVLVPGDYLHTPPGGVNDVEAFEDSIVFQHQAQAPEFL